MEPKMTPEEKIQQKIDYEYLFEGCRNFCQNCSFCRQNNIFSPQKSTFCGGDKFEKYTPKVDQKHLCPCVRAVLEAGRANAKFVPTQFERVKFFHIGAAFLRGVCEGAGSEVYHKILREEWARVLLYTYRAMPNLVKVIEGIVDEKAHNKTCGFGLNAQNENTYTQTDRILFYLHRKHNLVAIHARVRAAVRELSAPSRELAKIKFFDQKSTVETAKRLGLAVRTVQRRAQKCCEEFVPLAEKYGLLPDNMLYALGEGGESWALDWFRL